MKDAVLDGSLGALSLLATLFPEGVVSAVVEAGVAGAFMENGVRSAGDSALKAG